MAILSSQTKIQMIINNRKIEAVIEPGWAPYVPYLYIHDFYYVDNKPGDFKFFDEDVISEVLFNIQREYSEYCGCYIQSWKYDTNPKFYKKLGFEKSTADDIFFVSNEWAAWPTAR